MRLLERGRKMNEWSVNFTRKADWYLNTVRKVFERSTVLGSFNRYDYNETVKWKKRGTAFLSFHFSPKKICFRSFDQRLTIIKSGWTEPRKHRIQS